MSSAEDNSEDKVALSYHDCLLRNKDVDLLRGPHWLNDAIIGFYFEYLQHKSDDSTSEKPQILFVSPELTQLLKLTGPDEYSVFLDPLNAKDRNYILFPLNDSDSRDAAGGSHWSLLVYSEKERTCFHLDSCRGTNRQAALLFTKNIMEYFSGRNDKNNFQEAKCPQQENGHDCGLFVLCSADVILRHIAKAPEINECNFDGVQSLVRTKRGELLDSIHELKNKQRG